jgi:hypothetical protein
MQKEAGLGKGAERGCNGGIAWGRLNPEVHLFSGGPKSGPEGRRTAQSVAASALFCLIYLDSSSANHLQDREKDFEGVCLVLSVKGASMSLLR